VTNRLDVVNTVGVVDAGNIDRVEITVKKAPGANNIDLSATTLQFVHSSGSTDLTFGSTQTSPNDDGPGTSTDFNVVEIQDEGGGSSIDSASDSAVLDDPADRATIVISTVSSGEVTDGFAEGDTATVRMNTQSGGTTEVRLVVPQTLSGSSAVTL